MHHKLHIFIGGAFLLILVMAYSSTVKEPKTAEELLKQEIIYANFVQVAHATWGKNCDNKREFRLNEDGTRSPFTTNIRKDNALRRVTEICSNTSICSVPVAPNVLGENPSLNCQSKLEVTYRCFQIDKPRKASAKFGDTLIMDCSPSEE